MTDGRQGAPSAHGRTLLTAASASSPEASRRMRAVGRRDTAPEVALRRELHRRGLRYRVETALPELPRRRIDVVFPRARVAVLVDGCFWHGCPEHGTIAKANADYWARKIMANRARDRDTDRRLTAAGWTVVRIWEHEAPAAAATRVELAVRGCATPPTSVPPDPS